MYGVHVVLKFELSAFIYLLTYTTHEQLAASTHVARNMTCPEE